VNLKIMRLSRWLTLIALTVLLQAFESRAQSPSDGESQLRQVVEQALSSSPELASRLSAYRASADSVSAVSGALRPKLDLFSNAGIQDDRITSRTRDNQSFHRTGLGLSLTQLLWDGMGTQRDVDRFSHERYSRYFELLESTEQTSLEAVKAYYDVLRFRKLVALAEDNYVQHRYVWKQTQTRFSAGVGRGVDFEQVNARLALAESNLTTETANLSDVMARYLRVVGALPPASLAPLAVLHLGVPDNKTDTIKRALAQSPSISAAVESVRAAQMAAKVREGAFQPRIEARVRSGFGNNYEGTQDQRRDSTAEIVLNWNLYNGGTDQARVREAANLINQAENLRDKACRDVRQTADIAYSDTHKLTDQLVMLDRNTVAIEKARDAYHQQFDIGQRSLLDLLNAEEEVYTARTSYANAEYDRALAFARTHASMNQLTAQLGIAKPGGLDNDGNAWSVGDDGPRRCPAEAISLPSIDIEALANRIPALAEPTKPAR
jgi:outer membrane protein, adhesin transport system